MTGKHQRDIPTFRTKLQALRHGYITYGRTRTGARKFRIYKLRRNRGWNVARK